MNKIVGFLEEHVEKIILIVAGLVCVWLLLTRVIFSPNVVSYEDRTFSPGSVDSYIYEQAKELAASLDAAPAGEDFGTPQLEQFVRELNSSLSEIDISLWPVVPQIASTKAVAARAYQLPQIGEVYDVDAEHIRAVAYVPLQEVTPENPYDRVDHEPGDLDLVTVEAKFNVAELYSAFYESFAGDDVPPEWRDPCLAVPIFAAVQLQRQELQEDGTWGPWEEVPRSRVEARRRLFEIIEDPSQLPPGGLEVRMLQYKDRQVQIELLQPPTYQIASADEEWFPPSLHREYAKLLRQQKAEERRKELEDKKKQEQQKSASEYGRRRPTLRTRRATSEYEGAMGGVLEGLYGTREPRRTRGRYDRQSPFGYPGGRLRRPRRGAAGQEAEIDLERQFLMTRDAVEGSRKPTVDDVYLKLDEIQLRRDTDLSKLEELIFWAHDDTVQPKKTYRYRIRLGVFNPVAGKGQQGEQNDPRASQVILWSKFSDATEPVHVPGRTYFFALDTQEADNAVRVQVSKYVLGYWYSEPFKVMRGEVIGDVRPTEAGKKQAKQKRSLLMDRFAAGATQNDNLEPEEIDYNTGAVLVDIAPVSDWAGTSQLRVRRYHEILYSYDGVELEHMPVGRTYWPADIKAAYAMIQEEQRKPREPLKAWGAGRRRTRPALFEMGEGEIDAELYEMMMIDGGR